MKPSRTVGVWYFRGGSLGIACLALKNLALASALTDRTHGQFTRQNKREAFGLRRFIDAFHLPAVGRTEAKTILKHTHQSADATAAAHGKIARC